MTEKRWPCCGHVGGEHGGGGCAHGWAGDADPCGCVITHIEAAEQVGDLRATVWRDIFILMSVGAKRSGSRDEFLMAGKVEGYKLAWATVCRDLGLAEKLDPVLE